MAPTATTLSVEPLKGAQFGAEIRGLDPGNITEADREVIWQTYRDRHGLICFAFDHLIEADELHSLTSVFGENEYGLVQTNDGLIHLEELTRLRLLLLDRTEVDGVGLLSLQEKLPGPLMAHH